MNRNELDYNAGSGREKNDNKEPEQESGHWEEGKMMWCMDQRCIGDVDMDMNDMLRLGDD